MLPTKTIPYYVCAPSYTTKSAGIVTMHSLCHWLNKAGQKAYIYELNTNYRIINPWLDTPLLTPDINNFYKSEGIEPIHVYPDIVLGNPCEARNVARYLLHYPGAYGGSKEFDSSDHVWSFSPHIASFTNSPKNILSAPNLDLDLFNLDGAVPVSERTETCYYANKYTASGLPLLHQTGITKLQGTHKELASILKRSKICYVYENTSVISEAVLCGCQVILMRSNYFNDIHSLETQTLRAGVKWSDDPSDGDPLENARPNYLEMCGRFMDEQLPRFISETQSSAV